MKHISMAIFAIMLGMSMSAFAEDAKVKGVEVVPDTAVAVLKKVNAFFTGDLTWTMPAGKDKYRDDFTTNPLGQKTPRSTLGKYDDGVR